MFYIDKNTFKEDYLEKYIELHGEEFKFGNMRQKYEALGSLVRDYITKIKIENNKTNNHDNKQVYYFSMEFLLGRLLGSNLLNLGIRDICKEGLNELGIDLDELESFEQDQGLGNGGLGRLAACFLDSMASLNIPGHGCGIRYKYGFFEQKIINGSQVEAPENWLKCENVWEIRKPSNSQIVRFGGEVRMEKINGRLSFIHINYDPVLAVPYDTLIIGHENSAVNNLRLWSAEPVSNEFDFSSFSRGEYLKAIEYKNSVEAISNVLYPDNTFYEGQMLRLKQQYFFVSAGIQSIISNFKKHGGDIFNLNESIAIHINDTHPTLAIPELMRILLDEELLSWEDAWRITTSTISYTNHTIMAEALEKWPIEMFKKLLPRIYMIVNEINERFCKDLWDKYTYQWDKISRMAIMADGYIRMANLAIVGSYSVNGVAKLHTEILKKQVMSDFYYFYPNKFNNKTNGITHRRWLIKCNPQLSNLLKETIGDGWVKHPTDMEYLYKFKDDENIKDRLALIKKNNKIALSEFIKNNQGINIDTNSIFDVQVKRIHAYKRQVLNVLRIMNLYNQLIENPNLDIEPRTFIFAGKAAPGYYLAKKIIELINAIATKINNDRRVKDKIKVVFMENYRTSLAEIIIPAADISEQISTTTKEASGTSNMKFMMNGAITVATLDGANIEIKDQVSEENIIIFGLTEKEVLDYYSKGGYSSYDIYNNDIRINRILNDLVNGAYCNDKENFRAIYNHLLTYNDEFFDLRDFDSFVKAQDRVDKLYRDKSKWYSMSIINIAKSGIFSSDRTIYEYAKGIWDVPNSSCKDK
ncbi:glycogen/starch/alpha-glucan phosphorylase [Clostridium fallax]|uniref:Alpha-1,4 glucan phosphorylase n=1 Tax=Clostridium fallax TaxID=1533 RepID=A0A1M4Z1C1_9CLOT|nr:glycogen/starch/alpha-glucan phosphorylase [Clostridium fallax]SHF11765.1 starch phosphorylase [Clostridium fallax]SQB22205.1 glycogen phosphorylase [Clostridium fallax]